jgi:hypothetical protein
MSSSGTWNAAARKASAAIAFAFLSASAAGCHSKPAADTLEAGSSAASSSSPLSQSMPLQAEAADAAVTGFQGTMRVMILRDIDSHGRNVDPDEHTKSLMFTVRGNEYRWNLSKDALPRGDFRIYDYGSHRFFTVLGSEAILLYTPDNPVLPDAGDGPVYELKDLQKKAAFGGRSCERYEVRNPPYRYDLCLTTEFPPFPFQMLQGGLDDILPFGDQLVRKGLFPLEATKFEMVNMDGGVSTKAKKGSARSMDRPLASLHVMETAPGPVDPALFKLPGFPVRFSPMLQRTAALKR